MQRFRLLLAISAGKILIGLSRLFGNQGSNFPGKIARHICPQLLSRLSQNINMGIIVVAGTNGKTTTSNMIAAILRTQGYSVVHNRAGANMLPGISTAFVQSTNITGSRRFDYALLETDEATVPLLFKEVKVSNLLLTNFFRDQLDRYGELDRIVGLIKKSLAGHSVELLLNGDDPIMMYFAIEKELHCHYYGFNKTSYDSHESMESREGRYCINCGQELVYDYYHYSQLGNYSCPACGSHRPQMEFVGSDLNLEDGIKLQVNDFYVTSPYRGFYNAYNVLAAASLARMLGIKPAAIQHAIWNYRPRAGRMEEFHIGDKRAVLILVKNPTGLNQSLSAVTSDPKPKNIFFALNDNPADGRDVSWIWDADLEILNFAGSFIETLVCSGIRSGDIALRFKYSGLPAEQITIEPDLEKGIACCLQGRGKISYILSTYTALFACQKILFNLEKRAAKLPARQMASGQ
ncbi:Mur ligase family protein [Syntrophomonas palmitatica]|uniref:Mur ligase family protein n=1 Tax=Syntrophomonas palmitatica TaxID=402877 RepID=UPI0006D109E9|nr:Mur ligase family protein [Syntrophomonas palmitatica]